MRKTDRNRHLGLFLALCLLAVGVLVITACSNADSPTEPAVEAVSSDTGSSDSGSSDSSGDSGDSGDTTDTDVTGGSLQISMTDAPTDEICELWVYIEDLRVKKDGSPSQILSPIGGPRAYNLMDLLDGNEISLGEWEVETGLYQFIEMLLDEDLSYIVEKIIPEDPVSPENCEVDGLGLPLQTPLQIPSEKFKINGGPFEVGAETSVLIDFDADKSLTRKGNDKNDKGWMLKADVSIVEVTPPS